MAEPVSITVETLQTAAARAGITLGEEAAVILPLAQQILAGLATMPDERLRRVEPLLLHDAHRHGPE